MSKKAETELRANERSCFVAIERKMQNIDKGKVFLKKVIKNINKLLIHFIAPTMEKRKAIYDWNKKTKILLPISQLYKFTDNFQNFKKLFSTIHRHRWKWEKVSDKLLQKFKRGILIQNFFCVLMKKIIKCLFFCYVLSF